MNISNTGPRPIPPSCITRISLWRHGMERPKIISRLEFGREIDTILDLQNPLYADHITKSSEQVICFNIRSDQKVAEFGYISDHMGNHENIVSPILASATLRGTISLSLTKKKPPWITLGPANAYDLDNYMEEELFGKYVFAARFLTENNMPLNSGLGRGMINDLVFMNEACGMWPFTEPINTLGELARQALPQDITTQNIIPFPQLLQGLDKFAHVEHDREKKVSFGFEIVNPVKFPYPASSVSTAVRNYLDSVGWVPPPRSNIIARKLSGQDFKDGERMIQITTRDATEFVTELSFCIRKPSESMAEAPIRGLIIFRL